MGVKALRKIQIGAETTAGTAVAADIIWRGNGIFEDLREVVFIDEDVGYMYGTGRTYIPQYFGKIDMEPTPATFEHFPHICEAGIKTDTPAQDGAGSGYIYEYAFPTTSENTIKTYTIESGDEEIVDEMEYSYVESFKLSGAAGESLMMEATWKGRQWTASSFTGALSYTAVEEILVNKCIVYIDNANGSFGASNTMSSDIMAVDLTVNTGIQPVFTCDNQLYFNRTKCVGPEILLDITMETDSSYVKDERDNCRSETGRLIRLKFEGSAFTTAGTTYTYKTLIVDIPGKWEKFAKIDEIDGNDVIVGTFRGYYDTTYSKGAQITVVNALSALP